MEQRSPTISFSSNKARTIVGGSRGNSRAFFIGYFIEHSAVVEGELIGYYFDMGTIPLFIPEPILGDTAFAPWFAPLSSKMLYKKDLPPNFFEHQVERVPIEKAKAVVLPHNFHFTNAARDAYVKKYADAAAEHNIPIFCFALGDFTEHIRLDPRVKVFRLSVYRSHMTAQDIVMPTMTEDHGAESVVVRRKGERPLISFCGMGAFPSWKGWVKFYIKNMFYDFWAIVNPLIRARKLGVYWRRAMMRACERSPLVESHFIVRHSFSGNKSTIELDPAQARQEYLESIVHADFVLAPKGDGNYSNRFLKTLSLGRIPVVVDTDIVLPLEDVIEYSKIMVRVPMSEVAKTPEYVRAFYDNLSQEEWQARQRLAREVFEKYLRQDSFLRYFFQKLV